MQRCTRAVWAGLGLAATVAGAAPATERPAAESSPAPTAAGQETRIDTVSGTGQRGYGGDGGGARGATLNEPRHVSVDRSGTLYVTDTLNHRIRRIDPGGTITTLAGTGTAGGDGDGGPATVAHLSWPHGTALDPGETMLYVADSANHRIRRIDLATGVISTVAGGPTPGFAGDGGPATAALLSDPKAVGISPAGELWIADSGNDRVRRVDAAGVITTVAGGTEPGFSGDGGPAVGAALDGPRAVAFGPAGDVYVADDNNNRIRRVDAAGTITTVAGTGMTGGEGDGGPATAAELARPRGVAVDAGGTLYIADSMNHRVRLVDAAGTIVTLAGIGREGYGGDGGPADRARLFLPRGVAVDAAGQVFVADTNNSRVRRISRT